MRKTQNNTTPAGSAATPFSKGGIASESLRGVLTSKSIGFVSLGCDKNRVDTERMMYVLQIAGFKFVTDPAAADIIIVNTCSFICSAREESINTIIEMAEHKKGRCEKLIVTGCLPQKFLDETKPLLPEVDEFIGVLGPEQILQAVYRSYGLSWSGAAPNTGGRIVSTPKHYAYLKIAEGCSNKCAYCNIPEIRGPYRSVEKEKLITEAKTLLKGGATEIILVAQDVTRYGTDLYKKPILVALIKELSKIDGLRYIRLHYCYPELVSDELIQEVANNPKVAKYIEIPFQHISDKILKRMNRASNRTQIKDIVARIRQAGPDIAIRTSFIVGFPGENGTDYKELYNFVLEGKIDHIGIFEYSREKDTAAYGMKPQIGRFVKKRRVNKLARLAQAMANQNNKKYLNKTLTVVCEGNPEPNLYVGRSEYSSPLVDNVVYFTSDTECNIGKYYDVHISDLVNFYDLKGEKI
ncbi:MAG: 30S ribosomal protein S12 methylthiotransferase RimO [Firmicutes bacterium]|nr:30S ribosomal protein S12 methylthiotransferase RimO [Bacillota bacterium]